MIKHVLEISNRPALLKLRNKQLILFSGEGDSKIERSFACEDIGVLILQHPAISLSSAILNELLQQGAVVVICGKNHLPSGVLLPTVTHTQLVPRMRVQLEASLPTQKRAWQEIVRSKIIAQLANLPFEERTIGTRNRLNHLIENVKSGDPENYEAQAARLYWSCLFPTVYNNGDRRDPGGSSIFNSCLNYGYAILRAAVARSIVSSGLQPALGVHHHGRSNPFCLADDLMEPLRPLVDAVVSNVILTQSDLANAEYLTQSHREPLLKLLSEKVVFQDFEGPLMVALSRYTSQFYRFLNKETNTWDYPKKSPSTCS